MNTNIITFTFTADNMISDHNQFSQKNHFYDVDKLTFVFVLNSLLDNSVYFFKKSAGCNKYSPKIFSEKN